VYLSAGRRTFLKRVIPCCALGLGVVAFGMEPSGDGAEQADKDEKDKEKDKKPDAAKEEEVFQPGGDVKPPKLTHYVEPEFSPKSKEAFVEGVVRISTVITSQGEPSAFRVVSGLNAEEDRTAVEALKKWRFQPGTKNGRPVNVRVTVEVEFHLL
jgi:TonB family protein